MRKQCKITLILITGFILIIGVSIAILIKNANKIIKHEVESRLGKDFSVKKIELHWGRVEAFNISFKNGIGKEVFKTDKLVFEADFLGVLKKKYILSKVFFENPYIFLEKDRNGKLVYPLLNIKTEEGKAKKSSPPIIIKEIIITKASADYLDRKVSPHVLTRLRNIELKLKNISFPLEDNFSSFTLFANILGRQNTGLFESKGKIKFKTIDTDCKLKIRGLDITEFNPYFQKKKDVKVKNGFLDMHMDLMISSGKINAPGVATLRNLEFERASGIGRTFLSVPLFTIINFLKNNNNEIIVNFVLEGNLNDPKFSIRESLLREISIAIAEKLGLSIKRIGESIVIFGIDGAKEAGKGIKEIEKGIKKIFKQK